MNDGLKLFKQGEKTLAIKQELKEKIDLCWELRKKANDETEKKNLVIKRAMPQLNQPGGVSETEYERKSGGKKLSDLLYKSPQLVYDIDTLINGYEEIRKTVVYISVTTGTYPEEQIRECIEACNKEYLALVERAKNPEEFKPVKSDKLKVGIF